MTIYFDMDGTLADLYKVNGWLGYIIDGSVEPYQMAERLVSEETLISLMQRGHSLGIVSWTAKGKDEAYNNAVKSAKMQWLASNYPNVVWNEIHIIPYGTNKKSVINDKNGILVDDDKRVLKMWGKRCMPAFMFHRR